MEKKFIMIQFYWDLLVQIVLIYSYLRTMLLGLTQLARTEKEFYGLYVAEDFP